MPIYIALLRGINVGGHNKVAMTELRGMFERMGFAAETLLQSGNVVFRSARRATAKLGERLEAETSRTLHLDVDYMLRTADDWTEVIANNPFQEQVVRDPARLLVTFLKTTPAGGRIEELRQAIRGPEIIRGVGKHIYVVYPDGVGRSKLTGAVIEKKLGVRATGRNWNTVLKLDAMARAGRASLATR